MVEVRIAGIARDAIGQHIILLRPLPPRDEESRLLPIWIGDQEATSILIAVEGATPPRPLSHDLMRSILDELGARVERVDVTRLDSGTFYAEITLETPRGRRVLDARPSDAVAVASRTGASIWVADEVLDAAGIPDDILEEDGEDEESKVEEFRRFIDEVDPEDFQG